MKTGILFCHCKYQNKTFRCWAFFNANCMTYTLYVSGNMSFLKNIFCLFSTIEAKQYAAVTILFLSVSTLSSGYIHNANKISNCVGLCVHNHRFVTTSTFNFVRPFFITKRLFLLGTLVMYQINSSFLEWEKSFTCRPASAATRYGMARFFRKARYVLRQPGRSKYRLVRIELHLGKQVMVLGTARVVVRNQTGHGTIWYG